MAFLIRDTVYDLYCTWWELYLESSSISSNRSLVSTFIQTLFYASNR